MKQKPIQKLKPNPKLFEKIKVGMQAYKPLEHKDGSKFNDVEYFELLGRKCIEMDKANRNPALPTNYGDYDRDVVAVAKEVCKGIDNGLLHEELQQFLNTCINVNA